MPDRTKPSGIINLRDIYDEDNYYRSEFLDQNIHPYKEEINAFIKKFDPEDKFSDNQRMALVDKYLKNKHDQQFGAGIDRNSIAIMNQDIMDRASEIMNAPYTEEGKKKGFFEKLLGYSMAANASKAYEGAAMSSLLSPVGADVTDYASAVKDDPKLAVKTAGDVGEEIVDFASGLAAVIPRISLASVGNNAAREKVRGFNEAIMGANIPEDSNYFFNLLEKSFGEEGLAGPAGFVDKFTDYTNDVIQNKIGLPDDVYESLPESVKRGNNAVELAAFLASGNGITKIATAPYKLGFSAGKGLQQARLSLDFIKNSHPVLKNRIDLIQKMGGTQDDIIKTTESYINSLRQGLMDRGVDPGLVNSIIKNAEKTIKQDTTLSGIFNKAGEKKLPTSAQADVMDLTVQGGGSSGIQKLNSKATKTDVNSNVFLFKERIDKFKKNFPNHKRLTNLYEKIQKGEIEVDPLFPLLKINSSKNFDQLSVKDQRNFFNRLNNYNTFLKKKGDKLNITELNNLLSKEIPGFIPRKRFINFSNEKSGGSRFDLLLNSIVRKNIPEGMQAQLFLTKPTKAQLEKLKTAWSQRNAQGLFNTTVDRVVKLSQNDSFMNIIRKEKRLPSLEEIQSVLKDATPTEAGNAVLRLLQKMNGTSFVLPVRINKGQENIFKNIRINKKLAQDLLNSAGGESRRFSFYRIASYKAFSKNVDSSLNRAPGQTHINLKRQARAFLDDPSLEIHEPAGISTAGRFNLSSFANFVVPETKVLNEGIISRTQSELTRILSKFKNGERSLDKTIEKYNDYIKNTYPELQNKVVTIIKPTRKAIEDWYGKENVERYLKEYGMDLVGEAKEAGFAFGVPKNAIPLEEFININNKGNAEGGPPINREDFEFGGRVTTPEKDRIRANTLTSVGNYRQNLYGLNIDEFMEEQKEIDKGIITNEIPEGAYDPYEVARIIDREDDVMEEKRKAGYLPVGEEFQLYRQKAAETKFNLLPKEKKVSAIIEESRELLNPGKPVKFKFSELPQLITQNPLIRQGVGTALAVQRAPLISVKAFADDVVGMLEGRGEGFDDVKKIIPNLLKVARSFQPEFKSEEEYISVIQEINKMQDAGVNNLAFSFVDLLAMGIDLMADTNVQQKVKDLYDELDIEQPETFLGKLGALGIEIGAPTGIWFKVMNRARVALRAKGINTFVDKSTDAAGFAYAAQKVSNIAKRSAVLGSTFGVSDAVGMSRYSTVNDLFEDPLLLSDKEDITGLSGRDLALANFRNRIRFGADGAMIGGLFPLVGPPAWAVTKIAAGEVGSAIGAVGRYVINPPMTSIANTLAGKNTILTRAAEDAVAVVTGMRPELTGAISETSQQVSKKVQAINNFVGKQIVTRALLGAQDVTQALTKNLYGRGINMEPEGVSQLTFLTRQLPDRKDWSMFSVNSYDPLKQNLARIDNVMGMFRDIGKLSKDAFFLSGEAKSFIKSNMKATESFLRLIEDESYNLAQNFQKRYNMYGESKHIQNHFMDQVLGYLQGRVKLQHLAPELRETAKRLNNHLTALRTKFADLLPAGGMKNYMETNLREYMRKSFAMFTNPNFYPSKESIVAARKYMAEMIEKDPTLKFQAELAFPDRPLVEAIKQSAELRVADFMETLRYEMDDPLIGMQKAAQKDLGLEDLVIRTGEELPTVLRKLLGEENNLKASVLQTASSLSHQAAQKIALDRVARLGLEGGWLFRTAEEARDMGKIINASQVKETGTGLLQTDAVGLYGAPEIVGQLNGFNMFDSILKNKIYHNLIAFKATVQGGKTLYSPATQARNFGSASLFALNQGHIGGRVTVGESFKMIMDDIFGPGKNVDPYKVIENINRKVRLGVLDENIIAEELGAVLRELKSQQTGVYSITGLTNKVGNTELTKLVQKMYAGGDNVWKWHGHEYVKSQLTGNIKSIDEVSDYFAKVVGREFQTKDAFTGKVKTLAEGIEEMAAYMIRETYPTYSRVPPVIQALRKFPFGNFISFPAEIMRTTFAAAGLSLKHIASENPTIRAMGYKGLLGQLTTLYGVGKTTQAISSAMTGINEEQINAYTQFLGPEYMRFHQLIPITTKQKDGSFKAFDMSAYNPYDYMIAPIEGILQNLEMMRLEGSPGNVDEQMFNTFYAIDGPLASLVSPFISETIGLEPFFDVLPAGYAVGGRDGVTKSGSKIYDKDDLKDVKWNKSFAHILGSIAPGVYTTSTKIYGALQADISQGQQINLGDQLFKLMGGSTIVINPNKALDYKVADIKKIRGQAYNTEHFFSESNWQNRPAEVLVAEFENIQDQAFRAQFDVYQMFKKSLDSNLLNRYDVEEILKKRGFSYTQRTNLIDGIFTPVTYSKEAMKKRADNIRNAYPGIKIRYYDLYPKEDLDYVIENYKYRYFDDYVDPETMPEKPIYKERPELSQVTPQTNIPAPRIPDTGTPVVQPNQIAQGTGNAVNPETGLTDAQSVYLSPTEKLYYQRNKGTV